MKLTNAQVLSLAKGYLEYDETPGLALYRYTKAQRAIYAPAEMGFLSSTFTSGIRLDFRTDAAEMTLVMGGNRRSSLAGTALDVLQDGVLTHRFTARYDVVNQMTAVPIEPLTCHVRLKAGEKRVTVYLPYLVQASVESLELSDGAFFRPYDNKTTWIAFGDSITNGTRAAFPSMSYVSQTARMLDADVHNFGIGGETFRKDKIVPGTYPRCDFVTIAYGTNDYRKSTREEFAENMEGFLEKAAKEFPNVPIFVILPIWRQGEADGVVHRNGTLQSVRDAIAAEAAKYPRMTVLDSRGWVPHVPEFFADRVLHPNDAGFCCYAQNLYRALKENLT